MTYRSKIIKSILTIIISTIILVCIFYIGVEFYKITYNLIYKLFEILILTIMLFTYIVVVDFQYYNIKWALKKIENDKKNLIK